MYWCSESILTFSRLFIIGFIIYTWSLLDSTLSYETQILTFDCQKQSNEKVLIKLVGIFEVMRFTFYLSDWIVLNKYSTIKIVKNIHTNGWDFQNGSELRAIVPVKEHLINEHSRINLYLFDKNWVLKWQVCLLES